MIEEKKLKTKGVEAVDKALQVLSLFSQDTPVLSLSEISHRCGFVKSSALRLLISLQNARLVAPTPDKRYTIGVEAFRVGQVYQQTFDLGAVVRPALKALVKETGESGSFFQRVGDRRVCLFREDSSQILREHVPEGSSVEIGKGAAGHVFLDFDGVDGVHPATGAELERLPIVALGERGPDIAGIAAPVFASGRGLVGALALSGPRTRFSVEKIERMKLIVLRVAGALSHEFGSPFYPNADGADQSGNE